MASPCQVRRQGRHGGRDGCRERAVPWWSATTTEPFPTPHPGHEGRAGMAALVLRPPNSLDLVQFYAHVSENLPSYAWPRFLRLQVSNHSCCEPHPIEAAGDGSPTPQRAPPT